MVSFIQSHWSGSFIQIHARVSLLLLIHERVGLPYNTCVTYFEGWLHQTLWAELWTAQDERGVYIEIQTHSPVK